MKVAIVTSSHWEGDPRLNRHVRYVEDGGMSTTLTVATSGSKLRSLLGALGHIVRGNAAVVVLPDPELFVLGSLAARLRGKRPVVDIHEDYPKTASERPWIPGPLRPVIAVVAALATALGRLLAWRVIVAADHLAKPGDTVVPNIPDPSDLTPATGPRRREVVYVGEVTEARGALEMVEVLSRLEPGLTLVVIGRVDPQTQEVMMERAGRLGVDERLQLAGRMVHRDAWERAARGLVGFALFRPAPAYLDAIGTKIWEYMAAGLPPIVSDLPGQARVVEKLHPDLVCATTDDAVSIVARLAEDGDLHAEIVARGRALVEEEWDRARPDLAIQGALTP